MNREEVSRCYGLSMELLEQYESWNLRKNGKKDFSYSAQDLQRLSLVVLLQGIGFYWEECRVFLCLENRETSCRLQMLEQHRNLLLEEIHRQEGLLEQLDGLRFQLETKNTVFPLFPEN